MPLDKLALSKMHLARMTPAIMAFKKRYLLQYLQFCCGSHLYTVVLKVIHLKVVLSSVNLLIVVLSIGAAPLIE